jgi:hypothetical protein
MTDEEVDDKVIKYFQNYKKPIIFEGILPLLFGHYDYFQNKPIMILTTNKYLSTYRYINRDYNTLISKIKGLSFAYNNFRSLEEDLKRFKQEVGLDNNLQESTPFITNNTFYRNGNTYDVDKLIKLTYKNKPVLFNINLLKEFLKNNPIYKNRYEEERIYQADLSTPILVWKSPNNVWNIIDGKHRTQKALDNGIEGLPAYVISDGELEKAIRKYTKDGSII